MRTAGMRRFDGRTVLVLGGGADGPPAAGEDLPMGNGRAIALRLGEEGAQVAVTDIDLGRAQLTVNGLAHGGLALEADTGNAARCAEVVSEVDRALGPIDVVVCNTAVGGSLPLKVQTIEEWERALQVNVLGHWVTAQAALPGMLERGRGVFVFVGSGAAILSSGRSLSYEASKAAQLAVMRHIAVRYADRGLRANAAVLGVINSTMVRRLYGDAPARASDRDAVSPMKRQGTPQEVAGAVAFLASDDAGYVNGQALMVDGGIAATWPSPPTNP
jgi:NAD(P)-dependent dehydrogenase (short-subunit alcohol dehydrogenase family)